MKVNPMPGFVMIKPDPDQEKDGGIYLPEDAKKKTHIATLVKVGQLREPKEKNMMLQLKSHEGKKVLYNKYASLDIEVKDKKYYFLRFDEIVATI